MQARQRRGDHFSDDDISGLLATAQRLSPAHRATLLHNIGNLQTSQRDLDAAASTFISLRDWAVETGDQASAAKATASLAVVERHRGHLDSAIRLNRSAHALYTQLGMDDGIAHAEHNYALLLHETADTTVGQSDAAALRDQAAAHAITAMAAFDRHRHRLPSAADRHRLFLEVYGPAIPATLRICMKADRRGGRGGRHRTCACTARAPRLRRRLPRTGTRSRSRGAQPVGGTGEPVVLGDLAESILGDGAMWLGWWTDGRRLLRAWSTATHADADQTSLDRDALSRYTAALPIIDQPDLEAAGGDRGTAARIATWRAASGPMLADPERAERAAQDLDEAARHAVLSDDGVREVFEWSAGQLLWPLSEMLLSPKVRTRILAAHSAGQRAKVVVAPIPSLGRIPWAALPLTGPQAGTPLLLIEAAEIAAGLPASLAGRFGGAHATDAHGTVIIADPLGDLESARSLSSPGAQVMGATSLEPATRHYLRHALTHQPRLLTVAGHVRPGTIADPAAAAILLDSDSGEHQPGHRGRALSPRHPALVPHTRLRRVRSRYRGRVDRHPHRPRLGWREPDRHQHRPRHRRQPDRIPGPGAAPARRGRWPAPRPAQLAASRMRHGAGPAHPRRPPPTAGPHTSPPVRHTRETDYRRCLPGLGTLQILPALGNGAVGGGERWRVRPGRP